MPNYHPYKHSEPSTSGTPPNGSDDSNVASTSIIKSHAKADKRTRGEIACAECRRLKIRCDKTVPCSTCVKRGCGSLCPNGTVPPGEGSRFVLVATEHLESKLQRLEARMHSLEDALAITYATRSRDTHPLLVPTKEDVDEGSPVPDNPPPQKHNTVTIPPATTLNEALGVLHIKDGGSRFFGPSGSESLLYVCRNVFPIDSFTNNFQEQPVLAPPVAGYDASYLPAEINMCCRSFPFTPQQLAADSVLSSLKSFLPQRQHSLALVETFLEHMSWMFHIVSRQEMHGVIDIIYDPEQRVEYGPHDLALLLIVLSVGSMVHLDLPPFNVEAQHYYRLAHAALALQPILAEESFVSVKVLHLMSVYNGLSGMEESLETSHALLSLACQVASRIGCHVDPSLWGFKGKEAYDRRVYFWNLITGTLWQSLVTGRPPSILSSFVDCKIPTVEEESTFQEGEVPLGFGTWGFKFTSELLLKVVEATLSAKPPTYQTILELDQKVRDFDIPDSSSTADDTTALSMRNFVRSHYKDLVLLFLHRACFTQAMSEFPTDPLSSPHATSVVTAYQSACFVLDYTCVQYYQKPALCARIWRIWSLAFTSAVVVGTVATSSVHLSLQPVALEKLENIYDVFKDASRVSSRALRALPVLEPMVQKARLMLCKSETSYEQPEVQEYPPASLPPPAIRSLDPPEEERYHPQPAYNQQESGRVNVRPLGYMQPLPPPTPPFQPNTTTFSDLTQGWGGLFHETPAQSSAYLHADAPPFHAPVGSQMMDDRWIYFMNNYGILNDSQS